MGPRLVRIASATVDRLVGQQVALENARTAASALAQRRVDRLEVDHYLEQHAPARRTHDLRTHRGAAR